MPDMVKTFCVNLQINVLIFSFITHFYTQQSSTLGLLVAIEMSTLYMYIEQHQLDQLAPSIYLGGGAGVEASPINNFLSPSGEN